MEREDHTKVIGSPKATKLNRAIIEDVVDGVGEFRNFAKIFDLGSQGKGLQHI